MLFYTLLNQYFSKSKSQYQKLFILRSCFIICFSAFQKHETFYRLSCTTNQKEKFYILEMLSYMLYFSCYIIDRDTELCENYPRGKAIQTTRAYDMYAQVSRQQSQVFLSYQRHTLATFVYKLRQTPPLSSLAGKILSVTKRYLPYVLVLHVSEIIEKTEFLIL